MWLLLLTLFHCAFPAFLSQTPLQHECLYCPSIHDALSCFLLYSDYLLTYHPPTDDEMVAFSHLYQEFYSGNCSPSIIPPLLQTKLRTSLLNFNNQSYCVLWELVRYNDPQLPYNGFGVFAVNLSPLKPGLTFQSPHAMSDRYTGFQASYFFSKLGAKSIVLAGARRDASSTLSTCQPPITVSDPAHDHRNFFHLTTLVQSRYHQSKEASDPHHGRFMVIQFHGMARRACQLDVFLSYGHRHLDMDGTNTFVALTSFLSKVTMDQPWDIGDVSNHPCHFVAATNVQGRCLNGVNPNCSCSIPASFTTGHFLHIEQSQKPRFPENQDIWVNALKEVVVK